MRLLIGGNNTECKTTMEQAEDLPQDFADQINVFILVSSFTFHACQFFLKETNLFLGLALVYN